MKMMEELKILLFWLELNLGIPQIHCLKNLVFLHQLIANHLRGLNIFLWNDGSTERKEKWIESPNYMGINGLYNLGNYVSIYVH